MAPVRSSRRRRTAGRVTFPGISRAKLERSPQLHLSPPDARRLLDAHHQIQEIAVLHLSSSLASRLKCALDLGDQRHGDLPLALALARGLARGIDEVGYVLGGIDLGQIVGHDQL